MNRVILIGRLTKDAEIKTIQNDLKVAKLTLAVDSGKDRTDFINISAFAGIADVVEKYTSKGSQIAVEGSIKTNTYENKEGKKVYSFEVGASSIKLLGNAKNPSNNSNDIHNKKEEKSEIIDPEINEVLGDIDDMDMPF